MHPLSPFQSSRKFINVSIWFLIFLFYLFDNLGHSGLMDREVPKGAVRPSILCTRTNYGRSPQEDSNSSHPSWGHKAITLRILQVYLLQNPVILMFYLSFYQKFYMYIIDSNQKNAQNRSTLIPSYRFSLFFFYCMNWSHVWVVYIALSEDTINIM